MPEIPPWIGQAAGPAGHFLQAYQMGAQIAHQNATLQMQQAEMSQRAEMEQQNRLREDSRQAVEMARINVEHGLRRDELAIQQRRLDMAAKEAADMTSQQAQYKAAVAGGMDPVQALLQYPAVAGSSLGTAAEQASVGKAPMPQAPPGVMYYRGTRGEWLPHNLPTTITPQPKPADLPGVEHLYNPRTGGWTAHNLPKQDVIDELRSAAGGPPSTSAQAPPPSTAAPVSQRVSLAKRIWAEHPDWTKQQVIEETNRQYAAPALPGEAPMPQPSNVYKGQG